MFCKYHRARFEDEDTVVPELVAVKQMLRQCPAKGTPTYDDDVERPRVRSAGCAAHCLIEAVANIAAEYVLTEIGVLRAWACHWHLPCCSDGTNAPERFASL